MYIQCTEIKSKVFLLLLLVSEDGLVHSVDVAIGCFQLKGPAFEYCILQIMDPLFLFLNLCSYIAVLLFQLDAIGSPPQFQLMLHYSVRCQQLGQSLQSRNHTLIKLDQLFFNPIAKLFQLRSNVVYLFNWVLHPVFALLDHLLDVLDRECKWIQGCEHGWTPLYQSWQQMHLPKPIRLWFNTILNIEAISAIPIPVPIIDISVFALVLPIFVSHFVSCLLQFFDDFLLREEYLQCLWVCGGVAANLAIQFIFLILILHLSTFIHSHAHPLSVDNEGPAPILLAVPDRCYYLLLGSVEALIDGLRDGLGQRDRSGLHPE